MNIIRRSLSSLIHPSSIAGLLWLYVLYDFPVIAQSTHSSVQFLSPSPAAIPPLAGRGIPSNRTAAGTRGDCPALSTHHPPLTALVPIMTMPQKQVVLGITTEAYPTFWFYLPYQSAQIASLQFKLLDESGYSVMEAIDVPLREESQNGIVGFRLPEKQFKAGLEVGKYYRWQVRLDCQPKDSMDLYVESIVLRITSPPELDRRLAEASPREQVRLYAANGIWYEAVTQLQDLRQSSPQDRNLSADWETLLKSVGLAPNLIE